MYEICDEGIMAMRILFFDWGAYTYMDVASAFSNLNIEYKTVFYHFEDKNNDEFFEFKFLKELGGNDFDAVFSVNFFPLVSKCCQKAGIKYISWSYDAPLNVPDIEKTLGNECNYTFLFDRAQVIHFNGLGFDNVYHLPLAVNTKRLDKIQPTAADMAKYGCDVSFVGKLYESDYPLLRAVFDDYQKGYAEALINAQKETYGMYLYDPAIDEAFIEGATQRYRKATGNPDAVVSKEALEYAFSAEATRRERLLIIAMLSNHFKFNLYSREQNDLLKKAHFMGSCGYLEQMPTVFKASKVNLNNTLKCLKTGIPLRALDILGAGGLLLTNYQEEIFEHFTEEEVVMYESAEDAFEKAAHFLKNEDKRKQIALNGYNKVKEYFTYESRISDMLKTAGI